MKEAIIKMIASIRSQLDLLEEAIAAPSGPSAEQMDIAAPTPPAKTSLADPSALPYVRRLDEWKAFVALVGSRVRTGEQWAPWGRLVDLWGWKNVLRCLETLEPTKRWPAEAEALIQQKKRERSMYQ